jgi:RimJ/RimL family protein N-acetyltransferase
MNAQPNLTTPRLLLRPWRDADLEPFAALNADPEVMAHFPKPLDRTESDQVAARMRTAFAQRGFGWWAVEVPGKAPFIGFIGLSVPSFAAHFMPCVEIGWRLARAHWGKGYATEGAQAALDFAFGKLGLREVVAFTTTTNLPSQAVMRRLGMRHSPADDFDHPNLPEGHRLRRHVLYSIGAPG